MLVVDEAQRLAPAVAGEVLDEARKLSLGAMTNLMCRGRKRRLTGGHRHPATAEARQERRGRGPGEISRFTRHIRREDETMPGRHQIGVVDRLRRARK